VKIPFSEYQRRGIIPLAGLVLAVYYFAVLLPLSRRSDKLDEPVQKARQRLSILLDQTNTPAIDFLHITNQLTETRQALLILENAKQHATARLQPSAALRAKMHADFSLDEYDNERSRQVEELASLAKQEQVTIDPSVFGNYPMHTADVNEKERHLLWAALSFTDSLMRTAVRCKVTAILALDTPPVLTNAPPVNSTERLAEIPVQLEFTGFATNAEKLLQCLPLRADEIRAAGLPEATADKPLLFIDRLVVQKQSADKLDEVHVWLRAVGYVLRE
jgi:hypothetical protein